MWAFTVVVGDPLRQDAPQMPLVERNHPIETLAPGGPNESLAVARAMVPADGEPDARHHPPRSPPAEVFVVLDARPSFWPTILDSRGNRKIARIAQLAESPT